MHVVHTNSCGQIIYAPRNCVQPDILCVPILMSIKTTSNLPIKTKKKKNIHRDTNIFIDIIESLNVLFWLIVAPQNQ